MNSGYTHMLSQGEILRNPSRTRFQKPIISRAPKTSSWSRISYFMTFLIFDCVLSCFGMKTPEIKQAWREKVALCMCIAFCCSCLAFFTYGMNRYVCRASNQFVFGKLDRAEFDEPVIITNGSIYYIDSENYGRDSIYNGVVKIKSDACKKAFGKQLVGGSMDQNELRRIAPISLEWGYIRSNKLIVIDNEVFDPSLCNEDRYDEFISQYEGGEAYMDGFTPEEVMCFKESFKTGEVATKTPGCLIADTFLYISTVIIFSLIIAKFFLATVYSWYMKGRVRPSSCVTPCILLVTCYSEGKEGIKNTLDSLCRQHYDYDNKLIIIIADGEITGENEEKTTPEIILDLCNIDRTNVEPKGYISLMPGNKRYNRAKVYAGYYNVQEVNTVNIFGSEADDCRNNIRTRILVINKCGNSSETFKAGNRGKRDSQVILMSFFSKLIYSDRMSELDFEIYMKIKELMPHMDPSDFECLLMIDADTIVKPDALSKMVSIFETDPKVMGICGETMILNKCESWVTMIQVFEYYISHHLSKTFESVFGGVTCLPGCFCMYRIKIVTDENGNIVNGYKESRKEIFAGDDKQKFCLPILANQFIINAYSVFEAKTLHQKNLLHLGEDRYLTTLLLKNFYKRKTIFVPQAKCETYVPSQFKVLLSQRRRWINSTIHNLFELVIVDKLCGAFCCSMQFVVLVELFGTLVLPAAVLFTGVLIFSSIVNEPAWIPLIMLACIFGLPAVLIMITTFKITYIFWLLIYIISIPIWNFVLPVYAFWHFDDFSWGDTRKVIGEENKQEIREIDNSKIRLRELEDYLKEHRNEN